MVSSYDQALHQILEPSNTLSSPNPLASNCDIDAADKAKQYTEF